MNEKGTQIIKVNQRKDAPCLEICLNNKKNGHYFFFSSWFQILSTQFQCYQHLFQPHQRFLSARGQSHKTFFGITLLTLSCKLNHSFNSDIIFLCYEKI